jgi:uncharacterized protein YbjT (DUF2867 family)
MSELDEVKRDIARAKAQLASAEEQGAPFNDPGIIELRRYLTALYAEKARLETSTSGKSFGIVSEIHYTHYVFVSLLLSMFLLMVQFFCRALDSLFPSPSHDDNR